MSTDGTHEPETEEVEKDDVDPDVESDPALDDGTASEWASEGGATGQGPATDTE